MFKFALVPCPCNSFPALLTFLTGLLLPVAAGAEARASETYGRLPLHFEANLGQTHQDVRFLARGPGYSLYLTAGEAVLILTKPNPDAKRDAHSTPERLSTQARGTPVVVRMSLVGAASKPLVSGLDELPGKANYFVGKDPAKWRTNVPTYAKVHYREVYPGIDLVHYGNQRQLEYDFVVAPGADPNKIVLGFQGAERLEIDAEGELVLHAAGGAIRQRVPVVYQDVDGVRTKIEGHYVLKDAHRVGFQVAAYDQSRPLVIDPTLVYSTYLGGSGFDEGNGIAVDAVGAAYVTGSTQSADFTAGCTPPCTVLDPTLDGGGDAFVTKIDPTGSKLVYSTYLGGSGNDRGFGIAVDAAGAAYVTGFTTSADFTASCTTPCMVLDATLGGGFDGFVTKLDPTGSKLLYSTYLGGSGFDEGSRIAVDAAGAAYVTGDTQSTDFTAGCTPPCTVLDATLDGGRDAFVTKIDPTGSKLLYSTYLGGSGSDAGRGIAVDGAGAAYVTGDTNSTDFTAGCKPPCTVRDGSLGGTQDAFVTKIADIGAPPTLILSPPADTNPAGTGHTVTAKVTDAGGNPVPNVVVRFTVTGSVSTSGSCTTDASGQCSFIYQGPPLPGADVITAFADTNNNGVQDAGEPTGAATKIWILPVTTPLCEIFIADGGRITALNGDKASFGGNARSSATGQTSGQQTYQDQGPAQPLTVKSLSVLAIVCEGTTQASIYGQATINGSGSFFYRINVKDVGEPGVGRDTYWILLETGYNSGQQTLEGGNVQIRRTQ